MHEIVTEKASVKTTTFKQFAGYLESIAKQRSDSGCLYQRIQQQNKVFPCYDDAVDWMNANRKTYENIVVQYKEPKGVSKRTAMLEDKLQKLIEEVNEAKRVFHFADAKSKLITCGECGSKINVHWNRFQQLHGNFCPVCRNDMRPKSALDKIEAKRMKLSKVANDLSQSRKKDAEKHYELMWLGQIEYHC